MKIRHCVLATVLAAALAQPAVAMCLGDLLPDYLKNPRSTGAIGTVLGGTQLALVRVVGIHRDARPRGRWKETGTLELIRVESKGRSLPATFTVPYQKRFPGPDCETWDSVEPRRGERLLAFFRPEGKGWVIPELGASGVVSDVASLRPSERAQAQRLFHTRL